MTNAEYRNRQAAMDALGVALLEIDARRGQWGYRLNHDIAFHLLTALKRAGLKVVKQPAHKKN